MAWLPLFRSAGGSAPIELAPDVAVAATSVVAPTLGHVYTLTPSPVVAVTSAISPAISHVFTLAPPPAVATTSVPVTEVGGPAATNLTPSPAVATTLVVAPSISHVYSLTAAVAVSATSVPQSTVTTALTLTPTPSVATTSVPGSVVTTVYGLNPSVAVTVSSVIAVTLTHALTLLPTPAVAVTSVPDPFVSIPINLTPSPAVAATSVPAPAVGLVNNIAPTPAVAASSVHTVALAHALTLSVSTAIAASSVPGGIMYAPVDESTLVISHRAVEGADMSIRLGNTAVVSLLQTYRRTVLQDAPAGYWRLGETVGQMLDQVVPAHHGDVNGAVLRGQPGALADGDVSAEVTGTQWVEVPYNAAFEIGTVGSVECWLYPTAFDAGVYRAFLAMLDVGFTLGWEMAVWDSRLRYAFRGPTIDIFDTRLLTLNAWHHVVLVLDGANARIYLNGVAGPLVARTATIASGQPLLMGKRIQGAFYKGRLDEVAIYPTAISAARILAHYNAGKFGYDNLATVTRRIP